MQSAVVIVREDIAGDKRLVAYVVPSGASIPGAELKDLVRKRLPEYMVPSAFVEMKALPLSPNGKINRRLLPAPDWAAAESGDVIEPRNELEATLVKVWQSVLHVPNIGIRDNFFDLGGHSLMAARVLSEVEKITGKELPLSALFRGATVESLAQLITQMEDTSDPVLMEIQRGESSSVPFFAIVPPGEESLGYAMLARHMGSEQTVYKVQGHAPVLNGKRPYSRQEMQALTEEYIAAIRSAQPHGPYCLGGLCEGTHIGEQIVLGLEAQGEEVGLFAIFDTWVLEHSQRRWLWKIHYYGRPPAGDEKADSARAICFLSTHRAEQGGSRARQERAAKGLVTSLLARGFHSCAVPGSGNFVQASEAAVLLHQGSTDGVGRQNAEWSRDLGDRFSSSGNSARAPRPQIWGNSKGSNGPGQPA